MKINKDSWHYKLWVKSFGYRPHYDIPKDTDLCRYCHKVFWQLVSIGMLASMLLIFAGGILLLTALLLYKGVWLNPMIALKVVGIGGAIIVPIVLYNRWLNSNRKTKAVKEQNLLVSWVAAKKENVCPLVEFTDTDN